MNLHKEEELFEWAVQMTAEKLAIAMNIVEKDYYVTLYLKELVKRIPMLVFKGGTSLSKCHKVIDRFSEDIDLSLNVDRATEGQRKSFKKAILEINTEFGFELNNEDNVRGRREFNRYEITYPSVFNINILKPFLYIETSLFMRAYPVEVKKADSYIYQFLCSEKKEDLIEEFGLEPFDICVQQLNRTMVDKLFAIGDYYLAERVKGYSRHIYDIYRLFPMVAFDEEFKGLIAEVRATRKDHQACLSARDDIDMNKLLQKIADENYYKSDYERITQALIFDTVDYETALKKLKEIISFHLF